MIYIMRHGETDWNVQFKLQGQTNIPLNDKGIQMAKDAALKNPDLHFDLCFCSPLDRAKQTAEIFLEGTDTPIITDERLLEMCMGEYEGTQNVFSKPDCPVYKLFKDPVHYAAPKGCESYEQVYERTGAFIREVLLSEENKDKNILVIGHCISNCSIINQFQHIDLAHFWDSSHGNCELIRLV